jgi:hypothetical protein
VEFCSYTLSHSFIHRRGLEAAQHPHGRMQTRCLVPK